MKSIKTKDAYNNWAKTYDTVVNKTRDLDAEAIRDVLDNVEVKNIIEIGCGTGKNTVWLKDKCKKLKAVDFSKEMLALAKEKITDKKVVFKQADINEKWTFGKADLITCSLVLEHIKDIDYVFEQAAESLNKKGQFFVCEYHPYRQLQGKGAKFEHDGKELALEYFVHHLSEFYKVAQDNGFECLRFQEWFDPEDRKGVPRLVSFLFQKTSLLERLEAEREEWRRIRSIPFMGYHL
jgi:ubiquinone/menaquinone biosynthesis C-methylase UbiE